MGVEMGEKNGQHRLEEVHPRWNAIRHLEQECIRDPSKRQLLEALTINCEFRDHLEAATASCDVFDWVSERKSLCTVTSFWCTEASARCRVNHHAYAIGITENNFYLMTRWLLHFGDRLGVSCPHIWECYLQAEGGPESLEGMKSMESRARYVYWRARGDALRLEDMAEARLGPPPPELKDSLSEELSPMPGVPPEYVSTPVSLADAVRAIKPGNIDSGRRWLTKCIEDGTIKAKKMTRQAWVFDLRTLPAVNSSRLRPLRQKSD